MEEDEVIFSIVKQGSEYKTTRSANDHEKYNFLIGALTIELEYLKAFGVNQMLQQDETNSALAAAMDQINEI